MSISTFVTTGTSNEKFFEKIKKENVKSDHKREVKNMQLNMLAEICMLIRFAYFPPFSFETNFKLKKATTPPSLFHCWIRNLRHWKEGAANPSAL